MSEGVKEVVWCGVDERRRGRANEVCVLNVRNGRERGEMKLWNYVSECVRMFEKGCSIVLTADGKVGSNVMAGVVGKWYVGVNENNEHLVDICGERGLFLVNILKHRLINRCTWKTKDERGEQKSVINYVAVNEKGCTGC